MVGIVIYLLHGVEIYKFKAQNSETNAAALRFGNVSSFLMFQSIKIVFILMMFWVFINIWWKNNI